MRLFNDLIELLAYRAQSRGDQVFFRFQGRDWTFGSLYGSARAFAADLRERGIRSGSRVMIAVPNGPEFFFAFYGVLLAGGTAVPVFPGSGPRRLRNLADLCDAAAIIIPWEKFPASVESLKGTSLEKKIHPVSQDSRPAGRLRAPASGSNETALIQYTSGSLGDPKGVIISHASLTTNVRQMIEGFRIRESDRFISWLPLHHDMGLILMTMVPLYLGLVLDLLPAGIFSLRTWLETIQRRRATFTAAPDFAWRMCLASVRDPGQYDLTSLRVALNAAEPVRSRTIRAFESAFRLDPVMTPAYGLAESTVGVSGWTPGREIKVIEGGLVSVGKPFPGISVRILGGGPLGDSVEDGEIVVQSPANTAGYLNNREASSRLFWKKDWLRTGDIGRLDEDGDLFVIGREKNIIIQAGQVISPREIEELVDEVSHVRRSAALGIDRGRLEGEQVFIFVEVRGLKEKSEAQFRKLHSKIVQVFLDHFGFRPGRVLLVRPGAVPRTESGKVRYPSLKDLYRSGELEREGYLLYPSGFLGSAAQDQ